MFPLAETWRLKPPRATPPLPFMAGEPTEKPVP